ncbi:MAG TPA: sugar nucleotide-binding protein, partial [Myxococcaceae bacterium]|nr:sugar nucleotide-binding protein [Myxococcaceae bacterium]
HVSTDYVFDGHTGPYAEDAVPNPRGVYALTKHMGESAVKVFAPAAAIARTAVVYGYPPGGRPNFGTWLVETLRRGETVRLFKDQWVSPSLAQNVAEVLVELAERRLGGIWNACGADVVDRVTFGLSLCEVFGFNPGRITPVLMKDLNLASVRPSRSGLTVDKVRKELKAQPLPLAEALSRFREEYAAAGGG